MHLSISKLALAAMVSLFLITVGCGVDASGTASSPFAAENDPGDVQSSSDSSTLEPIATQTSQSVRDVQPTSPNAPSIAPSPTPNRPRVTPISPVATVARPPVATASTSSAAACGDGPVLTHSPMDEGTFRHIVPLGNLAPPGHTFPTGHMYFSLPFEETGTSDGPFGDGMVFPAQNVYAAADARVASLALADVVSTLAGEPESYQEFDLRLEVCDGLWIRYGHIGPLSDRLQALVVQTEPNWCNSYSTGSFTVERCEYSPGWAVEAGELIAFTSGRAAAFDFGASHPDNSNGWSRVPECPLDLYDEPQRTDFEEMLGTSQLRRTAAPLCGTVDQDVPGTAQGRWFQTLEGNPTEDQNIALVHDNIDPSISVFSVGNSLPGAQSNTYRFVPVATGDTNRDFAEVEPDSGVFCYEGLTDRWGNGFDLTLLIEMPDETTLRIEAIQQSACGSGPWNLSAAAATYLR